MVPAGGCPAGLVHRLGISRAEQQVIRLASVRLKRRAFGCKNPTSRRPLPVQGQAEATGTDGETIIARRGTWSVRVLVVLDGRTVRFSADDRTHRLPADGASL